MTVNIDSLLDRYIVFWGRRSGHIAISERIRRKLIVGASDIDVEAEHLIAAEFGAEDSCAQEGEGRYIEKQIRDQKLEDTKWMLNWTESYLWGLGIAGLYHQWERDIRSVIRELMRPKVSVRKLQSADFSKICNYLELMGCSIRRMHQFNHLNEIRLIANAIKHGRGDSFDELLEKRPELFEKVQKTKIIKLNDIVIRISEFDSATETISSLWPEIETSVTKYSRSNR